MLGESFQELENQTIFFASPEELDDPMEGFRDTVWDGDHIVWANLFKHYVHCLHWTYLNALIFGDEDSLEPDHIPMERRWDTHPTPNASGLFEFVWAKVRDECELEVLAKNIADLEFSGVKHKVRRAELHFYLHSIHRIALMTIEDAFVERNLRTENQRIGLNSSKESLLTRKGYFDLLRQIPQIDSSSSETLYSEVESLFHIMPLRHRFSPQESGRKNAKFLVIDYPGIYIEQLSRLLWPEWYAACFVKENHNSSMWARYGEGHKGVCLVFEADEDGGQASLNLNRITGRSSSGVGISRAHWGFAPMPFYEVQYKAKPDEVDFFRSLGRPSLDALVKLWYTDQDGQVSPCAEQVFGNDGGLDTWQRGYWNNLSRDARFKTTDWEYEQEFRLVLNPVLDDSFTKLQRTLTYDFNSLKGIVFGIRTTDDNKLEILDIIGKKCSESQRRDFQVFQAYYSPETGDIRCREIPMSMINQSDGE